MTSIRYIHETGGEWSSSIILDAIKGRGGLDCFKYVTMVILRF